MAFTVTKEPEEISLSRNRIPLQVHVSGLYSNSGTKEKFSIGIPNDPNDGETLTIEWGNTTVLFTFRTSPNVNVATNLPLRAGMSWTDYIDLLVSYFKNQYDTCQNWQVFSLPLPAQTVYFWALNEGSEFNATVTSTVSGLASTSIDIGVDPVLVENNFMLLSLYVKDQSGTFIRIKELELPIVLEDIEFDLSEYLDPYLAIVPPGYRSNTPALANESRTQYYYELSHLSGEPPVVVEPVQRSSVKWVLNGGVNLDEFEICADRVAEYFLWKPIRFLTNMANQRYAPANADQFLYQFCFTKKFNAVINSAVSSPGNTITINCSPVWFARDPFLSDGGGTCDVTYTYSGVTETRNCTISAVLANQVFELNFPDTYNLQYVTDIEVEMVPDSSDLTLRANLYYSSGSPILDQVLFTKSWSKKDIIVWPAGAINSGASAVDTARNLIRYELYVVYQDSIVAGPVSFNIVSSDFKDVFLIFENSLSGYETIRCYNTTVPTDDIAKIGFNKPLPVMVGKSDAETSFRRAGVRKGYKLNSGNLRKDEFNALFEMFESEDILLVRDGMYIKCNCLPNKFERKDEDDTFFNQDFEIVEAKKHFGR